MREEDAESGEGGESWSGMRGQVSHQGSVGLQHLRAVFNSFCVPHFQSQAKDSLPPLFFYPPLFFSFFLSEVQLI